MLINELFERFARSCPIPVALRATVERVLSPEKLDKWFESNSKKQYTRKLLFSTMFDVMGMVVFKIFPSINSAYQNQVESASVSITSMYNKLNGFEPETIAGLVRDTSQEIASLTQGLKAERLPILPGYKVKMLDGNCIEKTEHRLKVLRHTAAGPLPGKSLVVYDHGLDLVVDVFPCEDGHAQERSLLNQVLPTINPGEVWVADRNFCVQNFLSGIDQSLGYYIIRKHENLPVEVLDKPVFIGKTKTGKLYEQKVKISDSAGKNPRIVRLVTINLNKATRNGDNKLEIITNLPEAHVEAEVIVSVYRERWSIETMFQHLTTHLKSEINTLAYPKAALFGFCLSLIAYNLLSIMKAAMRSVHGEEEVENEVSGYYIAGEISRTMEGMKVALPDEEWSIFRDMTENDFILFLKRIMKNVILSKYKKHKRGPKKPKPKRDQYPNSTHVSTYKLLNPKIV